MNESDRPRSLRERLVHIEVELNAMKEAVRVQQVELARRLDELNHYRSDREDDRKTLIGRDEYERKHEELEHQFVEIAAWRQRTTGMMVGLVIGAGLAGGGIGALIAKLL